MNGLVAREFIIAHSLEGDTVADFCCGSGTVSVAALLAMRSAVGFELDTEQVRYNSLSI
jgi:DNA modification methylase